MVRLYKTSLKIILLIGAVFCFNLSYADVFIAARTSNTDYFPTNDTGYVYLSVRDTSLNQLLFEYNVKYYFNSHKSSRDSNSWYIHMWGNENDTRALFDTLEKLGIYDEIELKDVDLTNARSQEVVQIKYYPNPASELIQLEFTSPTINVSLHDLRGKLVLYDDQLASKVKYLMDVSSIESGTYIIRIKHGDGIITTSRVAIAHL